MLIMIQETEWIKQILPDTYICEPRENGVHCYSNIGIPENSGYDEHWGLIVKAMEQKYGERFIELFEQTSTNHMKFTVYLKK